MISRSRSALFEGDKIRRMPVSLLRALFCSTTLLAKVSHRVVSDRGAILEDMVYMQLRRRGIFPEYYLTKSGREVDFFISEEYRSDLRLIQIC